MKLISLNIWCGMIFDPLVNFIKKNKDIDIFCFQEVTNGDKLAEHVKNGNKNMLNILKKTLSNFNYYYSPFQNNEVGLAIFIKRGIVINKFVETFVYRWYNAREGADNKTLGRNIQILQFSAAKEDYSIINFHGLWNGRPKTDTPDRLEQSQNVKKILNDIKGKKILCGDFNLLPKTKSLKILEKGMINLIDKYKIQSTRSKLYDKYEAGDKFADYILVSRSVNVLNFEILQEEISDHLPLYLEFN